MRKSIRMVAVGLAIAAALPPFARADAGAYGFVAADGTALTLNGRPWAAIGVNLWDFDPNRAMYDIAGCYYQHADLDAYFDETFRFLAQEMHATAVRTFGFMPQFTAGGRDWSSTDKIVYYARKHSIRLIPVLGSQYNVCGSVDKPYSWYHGPNPGYRIPEPMWGISYRDHAIKVTRRYRDEPAIAFWQLMNEPDPAVAGVRQHDPVALPAFSRDMVRTIRIEAGDRNHLIQLGTKGGNALGSLPPTYGNLLDCGPAGGCTDLAEAHVYDFTSPLPGTPLASSVTARLQAWDASTVVHAVDFALGIDAWQPVRLELPPEARSATRWSIELLAPPAAGWSVYLDDVGMETGPAVVGMRRTLTFENSDEGISSERAAIARTQRHAHGGHWSLEMIVPPGERAARARGPEVTEPLRSVEAWLWVSFDAPAPATGSIASNLHTAAVDHGAPFIIGEAGLRAALPGRPDCAHHRPTADRASALADMLELITDEEHRAAGLLAWDFKDPGLRTVAADGSNRTDPGISCWSLLPGDPALAVLRAAADERGAPEALPLPEPLQPPTTVLTLIGETPEGSTVGDSIQLIARLTKAGNVVPGALVRASGACAGSGFTDALGHVRFACAPTSSGTMVVGVDPASCGCAAQPVRRPLKVKRDLSIGAAAGVGERGNPIGLTVRVVDPLGAGPPTDATWSIPACGLSGVVPAGDSDHTITATCPTDDSWSGRHLRFLLNTTDSTAPAELAFPALAVEQLYIDDTTRDCVGLDPRVGLVAMPKRSMACSTGSYGAATDWWIARDPDAVTIDADRDVAVVSGPGSYRVDGTFARDGSFAAMLTRPEGVRSVRA